MVRLALASAAAVLLACTPASPQQAQDFGRGLLDLDGGKLRSPDGLWEISAPPAERDVIGVTTPVILNGPGVRNRVLMRYGHEAQVLWPGSGRVVIVEQPHDGANVRVFALAAAEPPGPDRVQADIVAAMETRPPPLGEVMGRFYTVGNLEGALCLLAEWLGPPPGREYEDGHFDVRKAAFRIDLDGKRAALVPDCPVL